MADENQEKGKEEKKVDNNLTNMHKDDEAYVFEQERIERLLGKDAKAIYESVKQIQVIAADIFYSFYSVEPSLRPKNDDQMLDAVRQMMEKYMQTPEYQDIRKQTKLDENKSLAYTASVVMSFIQQMQQQMQQQADEQNPYGQQGKQQMRDNLSKAYDNDKSAQQEIEKLLKQALKKMGKKGFKDKVEKAMQGAEEHDLGGKQPQQDFNPDTYDRLPVSEINKILATTKKLMDSIPKFSENGKVHSTMGDRVAGYRITKNAAKAIAKEHAMPDDVFFGKMNEGWLAMDKYTVQEGAYYVLVDKSGSMSGEKTIWARSVAMALYEQAHRRGKKYFLRFFDDEPSKMVEKPEEVGEAILKVNSGNGTNIDKALAIAVYDLANNKKYAKKTNTVILITDGEDGLARDWVKELQKANIKVIAIMIQGKNEAIKKFADMYFSVEPTTDNALKILKDMRRKEEKDKVKN